MKKRVWSTFCLLLFCWSCTGGAYRTQTLAEPESTESIDAACSYFYFLWAKSAESDHRYDEAKEAYEKVLVCDNGSDYVMKDLAVLLIKMDRKHEAAKWLRKIIEDNPEDTGTMSLLAKLYNSMGEVERAATTYNSILKIKEDQQTLLLLGTLYARDEQYEKAQKIMGRLISKDSDSYLGHYYMARLSQELRFFSKAAEFYEKALSINWSMALAFELAGFYETQEDFVAAEIIYRRILEKDNSNESAGAGLVNILVKMEKVDQALTELWELRKLVDDTEEVDFTISHILVSSKKYDEAIAVLTAMLDNNPDLERSRYLLALAYQQDEQSDNAKQVLNLISPDSDFYEDGVFLQIKIMRDEEDLGGAIAFLTEKISDEKTRKMGFYIILATLYKKQEKPDEGRKVFEEALKIYVDDAKILYEYGLFLDSIGDQDGAIVIMQDLLVQEPENGYALNYVGYVWADNDINLEDALRYIEKAVALNPDDGFIQDSLGWVYFRMGDISRAVVELEKAIELVDNDPIIYEHIGDAYLKADRQPAALGAYERSVELYKEEEKKEIVLRKIKGLKSDE